MQGRAMNPYGPASIENCLSVRIRNWSRGGLQRASRRCTHLQAGSVLLFKGICACLQEERLPLQHAMPLIEHLHCQSCCDFQPLPDNYAAVLCCMGDLASTYTMPYCLAAWIQRRLPAGRLCCPQT